MAERKEMGMEQQTAAHWREKAMGAGKKEGHPYWWSSVDGRAVQSQNYRLDDGTTVGVPLEEGYGVEVTLPTGERLYPSVNSE